MKKMQAYYILIHQYTFSGRIALLQLRGVPCSGLDFGTQRKPQIKIPCSSMGQYRMLVQGKVL